MCLLPKQVVPVIPALIMPLRMALMSRDKAVVGAALLAVRQLAEAVGPLLLDFVGPLLIQAGSPNPLCPFCALFVPSLCNFCALFHLFSFRVRPGEGSSLRALEPSQERARAAMT